MKNLENNSKKMWNLINKINGKKTDKTCRIEKLNIDSKEYFDGKTNSIEFAKYFSSGDDKHAMQVDRSNC